MEDNSSQWDLPVNFYFRLDFQNKQKEKFQASFHEVEGISWNFQNREENADYSVTSGVLVVKRPLAPLSDSFNNWFDVCNNMLNYPNGYQAMLRRNACDIVIKLLDSKGEPIAAWFCIHAYPLEYSMCTLTSNKSEIATETFKLKYNRIERVL